MKNYQEDLNYLFNKNVVILLNNGEKFFGRLDYFGKYFLSLEYNTNGKDTLILISYNSIAIIYEEE